MALAVADNLLLALWYIHYSLRYVLRFSGSPTPPALIYVRVRRSVKMTSEKRSRSAEDRQVNVSLFCKCPLQKLSDDDHAALE